MLCLGRFRNKPVFETQCHLILKVDGFDGNFFVMFFESVYYSQWKMDALNHSQSLGSRTIICSSQKKKSQQTVWGFCLCLPRTKIPIKIQFSLTSRFLDAAADDEALTATKFPILRPIICIKPIFHNWFSRAPHDLTSSKRMTSTKNASF